MSKARRKHQWQKCPRYAVVLRLGYINPKRKKAHCKVYKTIRKQLAAPETVKWSTVPRDNGSRKKFPATAARRNDSNQVSSSDTAASVHPTVGGFPTTYSIPKVHSIEAQTSATRLRRRRRTTATAGRQQSPKRFHSIPGSSKRLPDRMRQHTAHRPIQTIFARPRPIA